MEGGGPLAHTPRLFLPQGVAFLGPSTAVLASIDPGSMCLTLPYNCNPDARLLLVEK
jgi:hypothetical protein